ncbi:hypothetical protein B1757_07080 [Acidithiobacillus marinus]|uniref:Iron transporter n=1 Tax=Acidithiobacillus marinus TaxID=187490 RepID=A0A2I1DM25_9PROT|nr:hypothetical protein [Acidithiobacillus marinus]PKY10925.1 hypothetical protein B1757_07080 [Acidithiobacillus marinus]
MKISAREIFPIVLGLADGTCTALVLASQKMMSGGIDVWQAFRIGIITSASGFLPLWVAEYAGLRNDLVHMAKQLNMRSARNLQKSQLGLQTLRDSWYMASIATASSFMGAAVPLSVAVLFPRWIFLPLATANIVLLGVGLTLGQWVQGARWKWALGLMGIGDLLAALGYKVGLS